MLKLPDFLAKMQLRKVESISPIPQQIPQKTKTPLYHGRNRGGENPNNFAKILQEEIRQQISLVV
jgi:hypothetical protein